MAENYEGINVSSGMGQGLAQVFNPYTPQYDMGEIGMVEYKNRMAQAEADRKKQEKLGKITENIKTPLMPPDYLKLFDKTRTQLLDYAKKGDLDNVARLKGELENIGMLGKAISDNSRAIGNTILQQPAGSFEGIDVLDEITKGGKDINSANLYDVSTDYMNRLQSIKRKEKPFDVTVEYNQLQNIVNPKQEGRRIYIDDAMAKDAISFAITTDPQWNKFAQAQFAAATPQEQAKYNGDYVAWGTENLYKPLLKDEQKPEPKGNTNIINIGGGEQGTGVSDVAPQTFDMNLTTGEGASKTTLSFDADGYTFTPVEASRAVPSKTYKLDGTPYTEQGIKQMSIGAVLDMPIASQDINVGGRQFKAGQPIPKEYFSIMRKEPAKYKGKISFKKMATALIDGTDNVVFDLNEVENLIATNQKWSIKGYDKYKANQGKMNTKARYQQEYPELFGSAVIQPTPSGNNKTSIPAAQGGRRR